MRHWWPRTAVTIPILLLVWSLGFEADAQRTSNASGSSKTSALPASSSKPFEILNQRNIFDPTRKPFVDQPARTPEPPRKADNISLVGVFIGNDKELAIFESSVRGASGTYSEGDAIGGLKILSVGTEHVLLQDGQRTLDLPVGLALSRRENEAWRLLGGGGSVTVASENETPGASADATSGTAVTPPPAPAGMSDIVKKMMERRQKESGQKETKQ